MTRRHFHFFIFFVFPQIGFRSHQVLHFHRQLFNVGSHIVFCILVNAIISELCQFTDLPIAVLRYLDEIFFTFSSLSVESPFRMNFVEKLFLSVKVFYTFMTAAPAPVGSWRRPQRWGKSFYKISLQLFSSIFWFNFEPTTALTFSETNFVTFHVLQINIYIFQALSCVFGHFCRCSN